MDHLSKERRSQNMANIKSTNTKPELKVRSLLHRLGYRFRLNRRDLPGSPDIVLPRHKVAIFVHGCFWHSHKGCRRANIPSTNSDYWIKKLNRNRERDICIQATLRSLGWRVVIVWECELKNTEQLNTRLLHDIEISDEL